MTSHSARSPSSSAHGPCAPCSSVSHAGRPETVVGVPGQLCVGPGISESCETSTRTAPGCNDVRGSPQVIVLGPVVHGGDSDWLLKLTSRSLKDPATRSPLPIYQFAG